MESSRVIAKDPAGFCSGAIFGTNLYLFPAFLYMSAPSCGEKVQQPSNPL
jgi:hypothetical protein